jgi:hypothetical protein
VGNFKASNGAAPPSATTSRHKPMKVYNLKWFLARLSDALSWQATNRHTPQQDRDTGKNGLYGTSTTGNGSKTLKNAF